MRTKILAYFALFFLILSVAGSAYGASDDNSRYLIRSHSGFWKASFHMRHEFKDGFTADLTDWQVKIAGVFGLDVTPVKKLDILPDASVTPTPSASSGVSADNAVDNKNNADGRGKPSPTPTPTAVRAVPTSRIPWGVEAVYNNNPITSTSGGSTVINGESVPVKVAVLDTGVFKDHPDLTRRIEECKDFTSRKQPVVDNQCEDKNGHGTHVTGTIAADGGADDLGIYGVAPEARILAYKVCGNNGSCWSDDIAFAIESASDSGANIISMSLGSDAQSSLIADAISYATENGVLVVAAAGNDGPDVGSIDYPGANPNVIAVGAVNVDGDVTTWSSRGKNSETNPDSIDEGDIEFAAPGDSVESTWKDGSYVLLSGTSMATPHVAGLAAKLWQGSAEATRELLRSVNFVTDISTPGEDDDSGFGFPHI